MDPDREKGISGKAKGIMLEILGQAVWDIKGNQITQCASKVIERVYLRLPLNG